MRIVIAPDSFKESATAAEAAEAIARGVRRVLPSAELVTVPMADGGEGTVDALVAATGGEYVELEVTGPYGEPVTAAYGLLDGGQTGVIEMAAASGLALVPLDRRDPRTATTRGTGELIGDALERGVERIIVGLGGSATNDAGAGMAQALGYRLTDDEGRDLEAGGAALRRLARIDAAGRHPRIGECEVLVACDVSNPLCGPGGASHVYGPQKGATPEMAKELDAALLHFGETVESQLGTAILDLPGGGAAGGLGAGLAAFLGAELRPGFGIVAEACGLREQIQDAYLAITGEGRLDVQTAQGKTPLGVAEMAAECSVPTIAIAGSLGEGYRTLYEMGIEAAFSLCNGPMGLDEALSNVLDLLTDTAEAAMRMWLCGRRSDA